MGAALRVVRGGRRTRRRAGGRGGVDPDPRRDRRGGQGLLDGGAGCAARSPPTPSRLRRSERRRSRRRGAGRRSASASTRGCRRRAATRTEPTARCSSPSPVAHRTAGTTSAPGTAVRSASRSLGLDRGPLRLRPRDRWEPATPPTGSSSPATDGGESRSAEWPATTPGDDAGMARHEHPRRRRLGLRPRRRHGLSARRKAAAGPDRRPGGSPSTSRATRCTAPSAIRPSSPPPEFDGRHLFRCRSPFRGSDHSVGPPATMRISCDMTGGASGGAWVVRRATAAAIVASVTQQLRAPTRTASTALSGDGRPESAAPPAG